MTRLLNYRQQLKTGLLLLLVIHSFAPQTATLLSAWWVDQQRWPGMTWRVVHRRVKLPKWCGYLRAVAEEWRIKSGRERVVLLACWVLVIIGLVWMRLLRRVISQMTFQEGTPSHFSWMSVMPLDQERGSIEMCLLIQVSPSEIDFALLEAGQDQTDLATETQISSHQIDDGQQSAKTEDDSKKPGCKVEPYPTEVERNMKKFHQTLSEKDRRRYAGVEALKLGHGGKSYIARVLGCNRKTVTKGAKELDNLPNDVGYESRIRKSGAGRKRYDEIYPDIDEKFLEVLKNHTAGDPMDETVLWTNLTSDEIIGPLEEEHKIKVSKTVVYQLLEKHNYRRRKAQKKQTKKSVPHRNDQFEKITQLIADYKANSNPIISMDTKKKELLGNFYRNGKLYTRVELQTYDHDFISYAAGVIIPHGIYDCVRNTGYINLGTSRDTSEFACDSFRNWWYNEGRHLYPNATSILVLCDGGGSNSSRHYIFKQDLQELADEIGVEIRIAHYPPYCSKYNPIEHRMFSHVTRACQGVVFKDMAIVKELMKKTRTKQGLGVTVQIIDKEYKTKRKATDEFRENMPILFDEHLPQWNYTAVPNGKVI